MPVTNSPASPPLSGADRAAAAEQQRRRVEAMSVLAVTPAEHKFVLPDYDFEREVGLKWAGWVGGVVLVEPVSGAPAYPLKSAAGAVATIRRVAREQDVHNLRLLADLYHLADLHVWLDGLRDDLGRIPAVRLDRAGRAVTRTHEPS